MNQPQSAALLFPEIKDLLRGRDYALLKQVLRECNAPDFVDVWPRFTEEERLQIFRLLSANAALQLFEILDVEHQRLLLERSNEDSVFPILEGMDSPELAKVFHKISPRALKKMQSLFKRQETLAHIDYLMKFPEGTAGSLMHPEFVRLAPKLTAKQALLRLQTVIRPHQKEHLDSLFVVDEEGKPLGQVNLHDLITAPEDVRLSEIMESVEPIKVSPETPQDQVSNLFSKYQLQAAPVVDPAGRLIGVLNVKDAISIERQAATEDIAKMAGTQAREFEERSVFGVVRHRMPWLLVTLLGGTMISFVIRAFEPVLAQIIALASFSPLIAGMGGNVGSQSATVMVRTIALGRLNRKEKLRQIVREAGVGVIMGFAYGLILGGIAFALYGSQYGAHFSIVVGIAMCAAMAMAATMGAVGPMLLDNFGVDPATATAPLVTTTTDIVSNLLYFSLATALLLGGS